MDRSITWENLKSEFVLGDAASSQAVAPVTRIEELTGEILDKCADLDTQIASLADSDSWRLALGYVHGAESRLWRMERDMLNTARDQANKTRPR